MGNSVVAFPDVKNKNHKGITTVVQSSVSQSVSQKTIEEEHGYAMNK